MRRITLLTLLIGYTAAFSAPAPLEHSTGTETIVYTDGPMYDSTPIIEETIQESSPIIEETIQESSPIIEETIQESSAISKHSNAILILSGWFLL